MFTKTIKQRIAVVAVSALTAGVLSVASAPVANAAISAPTNVTCTATTSGQINLSWTAPTVDLITTADTSVASYTYATDGAAGTFKALPVGAGAATTSRTITEVSTASTALVNNTIYSVSLKGISNVPTTSAASTAIPCYTGIPQASTMYIATTPTTTGSANQASGLSAGSTSLGWISQTSTTATSQYNGLALTSSGVGTGVVNSGAKLAFNATSSVTNLDSLGIVVTGGKISNFACLNAGTASLSGTSTAAACVQAGTTASTAYGVFEVSAAVGSVATIAIYKSPSIAGTSTATNGTLIGTWSLTVAAANAAGSYSAGDSTINVQTPMAKGGTAAGSNAFDYARAASNGQVHVVYVALKDAYGSAIGTASMTALTAAVTGTATVNAVDTAGASDSYAATTSFDTIANIGADGIGYVVVNQPVANTAGSSVLTLTLDGSVIATKTLSWNGDIASLAVVEASSSKTFLNPSTVTLAGGASTASPAVAIKNIVYVAKDAAGNVLELASHPALSDDTGAMVGASLSTADAGTAATDDSQLQTMSVGYGLATMLVPSSALRGAGSYKIKITNAAGATIKSQEVKTTVSTGVNTFTASWDKATYAPGEIATLTITGLDSGSRPVGTGVALGTTALVTTNTDGLASVTASCDAANIVTATSAYYTDGVKTCKFAVKNTEGSYAYTVVVASASSQAAIAGTIAVKSASTVVSNADVLKSIVALIASINKQIQALQKLILKR